MPPLPIGILGTGSYAPAKVLSNEDLSRMVDTSDEWIYTRTGIKERRIAADGEQTSDLAAAAARVALADAGITADQIDLIIVATATGDAPMPSTACIVQHKIGAPGSTACFDQNAACSGFIYALDTAWAMVGSGRYRHALVIGAEKFSTVLDWKDRSTCVLFGDGAGAVVIGPARENEAILGAKLYSEGSNSSLLGIHRGGAVHMKGREIFKLAVRGMEEAVRDLLEQLHVSADQIACVVPHQANLRIIDAIAQYLKLPNERFFVNVDRYGNTSAASIPIALDEARRSGRIRKGDLVMLVAFGAGLTYGAALVRW